jgi:hypothetical protein
VVKSDQQDDTAHLQRTGIVVYYNLPGSSVMLFHPVDIAKLHLQQLGSRCIPNGRSYHCRKLKTKGKDKKETYSLV